jgi:hypothetical protein
MDKDQTATIKAKIKNQRKWKERHDRIVKDYLLKFRHGEPITPQRKEIQKKENNPLTIGQQIKQLKFLLKRIK